MHRRRTSELLRLLPKNSRKCTVIASCVALQCILVFIGAATTLECMFPPEKAYFEFDKLARIMYLFDYRACGVNLTREPDVNDIQLDNNTHGLKLKPVKWQPVLIKPMTKTPVSTRKHMKISIGFHTIWLLIALIVLFTRFKKNIRLKSVRLLLGIFYYVTLTMIIYDVSMGLLYAAHLQHSLTKGMILRYGGHGTAIKQSDADEFAGWVPLTASICWMRGIVLFALNVYFCRVINYIRTKISKRIIQKYSLKQYHIPFPEPQFDTKASHTSALFFRTGETEDA